MNDLDVSDAAFDGVGFGFGFGGTFDGGGHTISNLTMNGMMDYTGLFCVVLKEGVVKNLHVVNFDITGKCKTGGLAGKNEGTITNCTVQGRLTMPDGDRERCTYGGLIGFNYGHVTGCKADVELAAAGPVTKSFGGLIGRNLGIVRQCCSAGSITVSGGEASYFGGFIGYCGFDAKVYDCFSTVDIAVRSKSCAAAGGFAGTQYFDAAIFRSFCSGAVNINPETESKNCGAFVGINGHHELGNAKIIDCFWNSDAGGLKEAFGINYSEKAEPQGLTIEQLCHIDTFAQTSWSIVSEPNESSVWNILPDSLPELSCLAAK